MTLNGHKQRIYGTLVGNCKIWLHRFAVVVGATSSPSYGTYTTAEISTVNMSAGESYNVVISSDIAMSSGTTVSLLGSDGSVITAQNVTPQSSNVITYFGDDSSTIVKNCGYSSKGQLSLLFINSSDNLPYAIFEIRKCKSGKNYIFVETYGETTPSLLPIQCWFNKGSDTSPKWIALRNTHHTSGIMPIEEKSFKFTESKGTSISNTLGCCTDCSDCTCLPCDPLSPRFYASGLETIPVSSTCCDRIVLTQSYDWLQDLVGRDLYVWYVLATPLLFYKFNISGIIGNNTLIVDPTTIENLSGQSWRDPHNITYLSVLEGYQDGIKWAVNGHQYITAGEYSIGKLSFQILISYVEIVYWGNANQTLYPDDVLVPDNWVSNIRVWGKEFTDQQSEYVVYGVSQVLGVTINAPAYSGNPGRYSYKLGCFCQMSALCRSVTCRMKYKVNIVNITNCRGETTSAGDFVCIPDSVSGWSDHFHISLSRENFLSNVSVSGDASDPGLCPHSSNGAIRLPYSNYIEYTNSILFELNSSECWDASIDYKITRDTIYVKLTDLTYGYSNFLHMMGYYIDDNINLLESGIEETFPFNYVENC